MHQQTVLIKAGSGVPGKDGGIKNPVIRRLDMHSNDLGRLCLGVLIPRWLGNAENRMEKDVSVRMKDEDEKEDEGWSKSYR